MLSPLQRHMYERSLQNYRADQEHLPILQALKDHDADRARKAMHEHIGIFSKFVASNYAISSNAEPDPANPVAADPSD
jgi:DNA-binding GntR family transcriptional regulator